LMFAGPHTQNCACRVVVVEFSGLCYRLLVLHRQW